MQALMQTLINSAPLLIAVLCVIAAIGIVRRVYRLARYFQLEGYENKRYFGWMRRQKREQRFVLGTVAALLLMFILFLGQSMLIGTLPPGSPPDTGTFGLFLFVGTGLIVLLVVLQPGDKQIKQSFKRTPRATRLLYLSMVISLSLPTYYGIMAILNALNGWKGDPIGQVYFGVMACLIALLITAAVLPLSNILLYPVEESVRQKFMRLAKGHLKATGAAVICITGSYGKTSTKHYLQHFLSTRFDSAMTPKSFNTLMGISRYVNESLADDPRLDYFIAEADAYFVGENASICRLVEPTIGMIMSVGPMHLERLGSMENVIKAQYEIIESLPPSGVGVFNGDDPLVWAMAERGHPQTRLIVTRTGLTGATLEALNIQHTAEGVRFTARDNRTGETRDFAAPLYGETNITNILMAAAVGLHLGIPLRDLAERSATLQPAEHRMVRRVFPDGTVVIDDAYSANPVGTKAALEVLKLHTQGKRRIVISSGMFELGEASESENHKLGENMSESATDVILIGHKQAQPICAGLSQKGFPPDRVHVVESLEDAINIYRGFIESGDTLLMLTDLPDVYAA